MTRLLGFIHSYFRRNDDYNSMNLKRPPLLILLIITTIEITNAQDSLFLPASKGLLIQNPGFYSDFDTLRNIPNWVAYEITIEEANGVVERKSNNYFKKDPKLPNGPRDKQYKWSITGYEKGHLKPAASAKLSIPQMEAVFFTSNLAPQTKNLNQNTWKALEETTRTSVRVGGSSLHIITGPSSGSLGFMGDTTIDVPAAFWKALLRTAPDTACIAFLIPNQMESLQAFHNYQLSVDSLEARIGIDLFSQLPDAIEAGLERDLNLNFWENQRPNQPAETVKKTEAP